MNDYLARKYRKSDGFTLIEVLITIAIIGILSTIAMPLYNDYITKAKLIEATSELSTYRVSMEQYFQDNRSYAGTGTTCGVPLPVSLKYFAITCTALTDNTYTALATATDPNISNLKFSINQSNVKVTVSVPSGWTAPTVNCWTTGKAGHC